jgi:hypothetical protein
MSMVIIASLHNLSWWNWDDKTIRANRDLFEGTLTEEKLNQYITQPEDRRPAPQ